MFANIKLWTLITIAIAIAINAPIMRRREELAAKLAEFRADRLVAQESE